jgi:hypothetical protein
VIKGRNGGRVGNETVFSISFLIAAHILTEKEYNKGRHGGKVGNVTAFRISCLISVLNLTKKESAKYSATNV